MQFTDITIEWSYLTFVFYISIMCLSFFIAYAVGKRNFKWKTAHIKPCSIGIVFVAFLLLIIKCFNSTGRDLRTGYLYNFESASSMSNYRDQTVESGFRLLTVIVKNITDNYGVFLVVVGIITILPVVYIINRYRNMIDVPLVVFIYVSMYFINGFSAYRQYMAVSISLMAVDAIIEKKPFKALIWIIVASTIHTSCLVLLIPYILYYMKFLSNKIITILAAVFFAFFYFGRSLIALLLVRHERYSIYLVDSAIDFGFEQLVYYAPMFLLMYICKKYEKNKNIYRLTYIYLVVGFAFGMASYILPILGRIQSVFMPMAFLLSYYIKIYKQKNKRLNRILISLCVLMYGICRFAIWIVQYYSMEDLMPYTNIFGGII